METPFNNLSKRVKEIEVNGDKILIKPKAKDVATFLSMSDKMTEEDGLKLAKVFESMISRAYTMEKVEFVQEDIEDYVAEHFGDIMFQVMEVFGFAKKEDIEGLKKKTFDKMAPKGQ